jgi:hyperosmotically inducible periplasmic protein
MGTQIDGSLITTSVKPGLLADPASRRLDTSVLTVNGTVQLTGFVDNRSQGDEASAIARATEGAANVKNKLALKR